VTALKQKYRLRSKKVRLFSFSQNLILRAGFSFIIRCCFFFKKIFLFVSALGHTVKVKVSKAQRGSGGIAVLFL